MSTALFNAITGLNNYQKVLDTVANNISNLSTPGYKKAKVGFRELLSQTIRGAAAPYGNLGGTNPIQLGLGSTLGSIETNFNQGIPEVTGRATDLSITGDGFFIVRGERVQGYTRNGSFNKDTDGNLIDSNGYKVLGWMAQPDGTVNTSGPLEPVMIPIGQQAIARATSITSYIGNLDASQAVYDPISGEGGRYIAENIIYDSLGIGHKLAITFTKTAGNTWDWEAHIGADPVAAGDGQAVFTAEGQYDPAGSTVNPIQNYDPGTGAELLTIDLGFSQVTQLSTPGQYSVTMKSQNGCEAGVLADFSIDRNGQVIGVFTNGMTQLLGVVGLAYFVNPQGLTKSTGGVYSESANSGPALIGQPNTDSRGAIEAGTLEMSNVDLGTEFTSMIIAQRAFQANSRVVSTMDQMLEELANMKR